MFHRSSPLAAVVLLLAAHPGLAQDRLPLELKATQLQGAGADFDGVRVTIAPDGAWKTEDIVDQKAKPKSNGRLSEANLEKLAKLLAKVDAAKLPATSGTAPNEKGARQYWLTIEMGRTKASWVGATAPDVRPDNPNESVESRFAAIWEAIRVMTLVPPA